VVGVGYDSLVLGEEKSKALLNDKGLRLTWEMGLETSPGEGREELSLSTRT
jgi:hypothetical protein